MLGYTPYGIDALKTGSDRTGRGSCVSQLASPLVSVVKGLTLMLCCKSMRDTAPLGLAELFSQTVSTFFTGPINNGATASVVKSKLLIENKSLALCLRRVARLMHSNGQRPIQFI